MGKEFWEGWDVEEIKVEVRKEINWRNFCVENNLTKDNPNYDLVSRAWDTALEAADEFMGEEESCYYGIFNSLGSKIKEIEHGDAQDDSTESGG